eukprot:GFYU01004214.1.p1 GENE.GFYU01004214.1~~GFYU01004214.1.p1  ORF type:complete len:163 (+),score=38.36 GFYU01004214.1:78-566(+)
MKFVFGFLAVLAVVGATFSSDSVQKAHLGEKLDRAASLIAELDELAGEHEDIAEYIRQSMKNVLGGVFLQVRATTGAKATTGAMARTGRHTATAYAECIEAWIDETPVHIHNKCQDSRKVTIECQHKVDECIIAPESTERCGECGAPDINKDEFKVTKSGGN